MEGRFFENDNPYKPGSMIRMLPQCSNCGLDYSYEPGFYIGAMYVSYAIAVALAVGTGLLTYFLFHPGFAVIVSAICGVLLVSSPVNFRLARLIWINIWVKYDPERHLKN